MSMKGLTKCAVAECDAPISGCNNLCENHRVPGVAVQVDDSTMIITLWYAEHLSRPDECSFIFLNDYALGDLFDGRVGFETSLQEQGFVNVRLLTVQEVKEIQAKQLSGNTKKVRGWGQSWLEAYRGAALGKGYRDGMRASLISKGSWKGSPQQAAWRSSVLDGAEDMFP